MCEDYFWRCIFQIRRKSIFIRSKMYSFRTYLRRTDILFVLRAILDRAFANKRLVLGIIVALLILLYTGPYFLFGRKFYRLASSHVCLDSYLQQTYKHYLIDEHIYYSFVNFVRDANVKDRKFVPFVGNGLFGLNVADSSKLLYIRHRDTLSVDLPFDPIVNLNANFPYSEDSEAFVLDTFNGIVIHVTAYSVNGECVLSTSTIYAHRLRPDILVQEIHIENPSRSTLTFGLSRKSAQADNFKAVNDEQDLKISSSQAKVGNSKQYYNIVVGQPNNPSSLTAKPNGQEILRLKTVIKISDLMHGLSDKKPDIDEMLKEVRKIFDNIKDNSHDLDDHKLAWNELWNQGFSISYSKAPNSLNMDLINTTIYYLLSNSVSTSLLTQNIDNKQKQQYKREDCFNAHNTLLFPSKLWLDLDTTRDVIDVAYRWKITLDKRGCSSLIRAGAEGVLQAALLSLGGFKFTKEHLEFDVDPSELHRDYFFRGIIYDSDTRINVWVEVGTDNKPVLYAATNGTTADGKKFYACDAGCLDEPVELKTERISLPVKLTDPLTPILYVTDDLNHIQELKHAIHVKEVVEAPAHEHHVIAMHKHGHRLGGLPTFFWVALIFLLVTFHLFLFKLIYNEYCRDDNKLNNNYPSGRLRYSNTAYGKC